MEPFMKPKDGNKASERTASGAQKANQSLSVSHLCSSVHICNLLFWAPRLTKDAHHIAPKLQVYRSNHNEWAALLWESPRKWTWNGQCGRGCRPWSSCMWLRRERMSSYTKWLGIKEGSPQSRKTFQRVSIAEEEKLQTFWELESSKK